MKLTKQEIAELRINYLRQKIEINRTINSYVVGFICSLFVAIISLPANGDSGEYHFLKLAIYAIMMVLAIFCFIKANRIDKRK